MLWRNSHSDSKSPNKSALFGRNHNPLIAIKRIVSIPIVCWLPVELMWFKSFTLKKNTFEQRMVCVSHLNFRFQPVQMYFGTNFNAQKMGNIGLICLKMLMVTVWIYVCVSVKYQRIWIKKTKCQLFENGVCGGV